MQSVDEKHLNPNPEGIEYLKAIIQSFQDLGTD